MNKECQGPECAREAVTRGYCGGHYQQVYHGRELKPLRPKARNSQDAECMIPGCSQARASRGLCARHASVSNRHHILPEEYARLWGSGCAICGESEKLQVDHDHSCCPGEVSCGKCIRGLLCGPCNTSLAGIEKNMSAVIDYLGAPRPDLAEYFKVYR